MPSYQAKIKNEEENRREMQLIGENQQMQQNPFRLKLQYIAYLCYMLDK